ncbi:hypothetical protein [Desulfatitalea alkaliphila]|uniref:Uncharacterized protein n=1 Tax=Desulfatitalea alkaliphila TaxID=2929485 RepID=A0AA41R6G5_9BACT|nr:hypothetical protein [Desulfatitalea alkaliphila]MCJ8502055.1 hypothetical protein [Desulfatitalea alkaliphila]
MKCPKCGYQRQDRDDLFVAATECPACGVVYAKCASVAPAEPVPAGRAEGAVPQTSPVHEASLRQARERVEMRLRKRADIHLQEEQRLETLERARRITAEMMRQRREQRSELSNAAALPEIAAAEPAHDPAPATTQETVPAHDVEYPAIRSDQGQADGGDTPVADPQAPSFDKAAPSSMVMEPMAMVPSQVSVSEPAATPPEIPAAPKDNDVSADSYRETETEALPSASLASLPPQPTASALRPVVAWGILGAGTLGALICWFTIGTGFAMAENPSGRGTGLFTLGLLLGFAYLATGALGFVLFRAAARFAAEMAEIRSGMDPGASATFK